MQSQQSQQSSTAIKLFSSAVALVVAWVFFKTFADPIGLNSADFMSMVNIFVHSMNLVVHEAGHTIFFFLPQLFVVAAGSLFQIAVPVCFALYFFMQGSIRSGSYVLFWVANSIADVAVYVGDAVRLELPLLGGDGVIHDWNFILGELGLLHYANNIAVAMHALAIIVLAVAVSLIIWSIWTGVKEGPNMNLGE